GCTEQTMSRFLPAAIVSKTLTDLGLNPEDVMNRAFGGIEAAHATETHPHGKRDLAELKRIMQEGLERLRDFQHSDGGWGWLKEGESDRWMTAYVLWGLSLARGADLQPAVLNNSALENAARFLDLHLVEEEENFDMQAWMLHALAIHNASLKKSASAFQTKAF